MQGKFPRRAPGNCDITLCIILLSLFLPLVPDFLLPQQGRPDGLNLLFSRAGYQSSNLPSPFYLGVPTWLPRRWPPIPQAKTFISEAGLGPCPRGRNATQKAYKNLDRQASPRFWLGLFAQDHNPFGQVHFSLVMLQTLLKPSALSTYEALHSGISCARVM